MRLVRANEHQGNLRARVLRLLHSRRAVRRFRVVSETAGAHFFALLVLGAIFARAYDALRHRPSGSSFWLAWLLANVVAAAFALYFARTLKDLQPPIERLPRKKWRGHAAGAGAGVALGVAYLVWNAELLLWWLVGLLGRLLVLPTCSCAMRLWLTFPLPLVLAAWAFVAARTQMLEALQNALPPELRLAVDLRERADAFRDRARSLEEAMEDATRISEQLQQGIELERQQLSQVHEDYQRMARLKELTPDQANAVAELLARQQARGERRAIWFNVLVGLVFYLLGVLTQALISTDAFGDQLRRWLHLR